ncbi:MAG: hypothetical protein Ta2A_08920 [Treponemataceae bacterium]|nr:MAG: hypothetical protein Ta2A_08920 [Treponemataceae bacterium]
MNGRSEHTFVLDSNFVIDFLNNKIAEFPTCEWTEAQYFVSIITRMEILAAPKSTPEDEKDAHTFLSGVTVIPLTDEVERVAIEIRRRNATQKPKIKLPDAIIAATAIALDATLVTRDSDLLKLNFPGLSTLSIA